MLSPNKWTSRIFGFATALFGLIALSLCFEYRGSLPHDQLAASVGGHPSSYIIQAESAEIARAAVLKVGGLVTHDLPIIDGVAARPRRLPFLATGRLVFVKWWQWLSSLGLTPARLENGVELPAQAPELLLDVTHLLPDEGYIQQHQGAAIRAAHRGMAPHEADRSGEPHLALCASDVDVIVRDDFFQSAAGHRLGVPIGCWSLHKRSFESGTAAVQRNGQTRKACRPWTDPPV
jgi:hypothetical protein